MAPPGSRTELDERTVAPLLADLGVLSRDADPEVARLAGGVANAVLGVVWPGGEVVAKQALPKLRVAADWPFDPSRTSIECECLRYLGRLLPPGSVPEVVAFDSANDVLVISRAPGHGVVWKQALLRGEVEPRVGEQLGALLGTVHRNAAGDEIARRAFAAQWPLTQGRTDPFHRTAAARHPELRAAVLAETERLEATRSTLVLGDFSPKNIIVYPDRGPLLLDFEVAHFGDPAFDLGFLLTHLSLKSLHRPTDSGALHACASRFLAAYGESAGDVAPAPAPVIAELGCLLLSRVDGKSPVEYLGDEAERVRVRAVARRLLLEPPEALEPALALVFAGLAGELAGDA